jgi:hypothetical protein
VQDIRRIAFVSQRFFDLQGFGPALYGAGLILGAFTLHFAAGTETSSSAFMPLILAGMFSGNGPLYLQRSYRRSFGTTVGTQFQQFAATVPHLLVTAAGLADMIFQFTGRSAPSVVAIAVAACSTMIVFRDWPWRMHHLIGVAAGVTGAIITSMIPVTIGRWGGIGPERVEAYLLAYTVVGLGLMATGLLDHHLLASSMGNGGEAEPRPVHDRRDAIPNRVAIAGLSSVLLGGAVWLTSERVISGALLPLLLIIAIPVIVVVNSLRDIPRIVSAIRRCERLPGPPGFDLHVGGDVLAAFFAVATATAVDSAIFPNRVPYMLIVGLVIVPAWLVIRDWPRRRHYAIVVVAGLLAAALTRHFEPARAFAVFMSVIAGALAIAWTIEERRSRTENGPPSHI